MKIFCKNCRWFKEKEYIDESNCAHLSNLKIKEKWYGKDEYYKKKPKKKNRKNNCKYFERNI